MPSLFPSVVSLLSKGWHVYFSTLFPLDLLDSSLIYSQLHAEGPFLKGEFSGRAIDHGHGSLGTLMHTLALVERVALPK